MITRTTTTTPAATPPAPLVAAFRPALRLGEASDAERALIVSNDAGGSGVLLSLDNGRRDAAAAGVGLYDLRMIAQAAMAQATWPQPATPVAGNAAREREQALAAIRPSHPVSSRPAAPAGLAYGFSRWLAVASVMGVLLWLMLGIR